MADEIPTGGSKAADGLPEEEFARLLNGVSAMAPLLKGLFSTTESPQSNDPKGRREALLLALKPYLSPARCAAVDYFIRLARVGEALRTLQ
jgi:hypothetical protein